MSDTYPPTFVPPRNLNAPRFETFDSSKVKVHENEYVELDSGQWFVKGTTVVEKQFPVDFYLREMKELPNTFDQEGVIQFVNEWGVFADVLERDIPAAMNLENHLGTNVWGGEKHSWNTSLGSLHEARRAAISELGLMPEGVPSSSPDYGTAYYETELRVVNIAEVRLRLVYMLNFNLFRSAIQSGKPFSEFESEALLKINSAMTCFAPHLVVDSDLFGAYEPTIYNLAALQMALDIRDEISIRICQNERCGREFTRQRGGAKFGEYRLKGEVKYCSVSCLNAQNMRAKRQAKKAMKEGTS